MTPDFANIERIAVVFLETVEHVANELGKTSPKCEVGAGLGLAIASLSPVTNTPLNVKRLNILAEKIKELRDEKNNSDITRTTPMGTDNTDS